MTKQQEWLARQKCLARQELQQATQVLVQRAPGAAKKFVGDRPGTSMAIAAAAGFAAGFAVVRRSSTGPSPSTPGPSEDNRASRGFVPTSREHVRDLGGWMHSATQALRAFVSAAAVVKAVSSEWSAASESTNGHGDC